MAIWFLFEIFDCHLISNSKLDYYLTGTERWHHLSQGTAVLLIPKKYTIYTHVYLIIIQSNYVPGQYYLQTWHLVYKKITTKWKSFQKILQAATRLQTEKFWNGNVSLKPYDVSLIEDVCISWNSKLLFLFFIFF